MLAFVFITVSCSVKENRLFCPSWVRVVPANIQEGLWKTIDMYAFRNGKCEHLGIYDFQEFIHEGVDLPVMPGKVQFSGVVGWPGDWPVEEVLAIPYGEQAPESLGFVKETVVGDEELDFSASMHPLFANVFIHVVGRGKDYPWEMVMQGEVDGYELATLEPHKGNFASELDELNIQNFFVRVPRQMDESLHLSLFPKGETKAWSGDDVYSLPVGKMVAEGGYNWNADSLDDIYLKFDYASGRVEITVDDWVVVRMVTRGSDDGEYVI